MPKYESVTETNRIPQEEKADAEMQGKTEASATTTQREGFGLASQNHTVDPKQKQVAQNKKYDC